MRKMASIQRIEEITPIPNADKICVARILGWNVIVKTNEFKTGDLCVYVEIDSLLPKDVTAFAFMEKYKYRVKSIRLRGQISQGLALPLSAFSNETLKCCGEGTDVSDILGVTKYDPETQEESEIVHKGSKTWWAKYMRFYLFRKLIYPLVKTEKDNFPSDIVSKTDETRIQSCPKVLSDFKDETFIVTEKMEGCSGTFIYKPSRFFRKPVFMVCSRNKRLVHPDSSRYWKIAKDFEIKSVLKNMYKERKGTWVIQGEIIGEGIQGNIYGIKGLDFYVFNLIHIDRKGNKKNFDYYAGSTILRAFSHLKWVPKIEEVSLNGKTVDEIVVSADGKSLVADVSREGKVYRCLNPERMCSFKAVSNAYLLEHGK